MAVVRAERGVGDGVRAGGLPVDGITARPWPSTSGVDET
eukprot:CAMPEP_0205939084 /NCGR_PEP_ID=MMETSP1325-20131115/48674_1 /ASSEMBLY_ACC=CAM_ASM_000708 /TAXON_ID=236786 /ORGANISM="Florenciella sp., Strain RCC1007" /LENGTH=38 /DNA_ID= /DNA_START= /DNA_END= /DNA_ORIENTATION=